MVSWLIFCRETIDFLGLRLDPKGSGQSHIIQSIKDIEQPTELKSTWSFFGLVEQV